MKITILTFVLSVLSIIFFKDIELQLLHWNISWTISKIFPYILTLVFGFVLVKKIMKNRLKRKKIIRISLSIILFLIPFAVAFSLNPIYEGDFSKEGKEIKTTNKLTEFQNADLLVLTIQNCPFCRESVYKMNLLMKRNPKLKIKYIVCSKNPDATKELRGHLDERIKIVLVQNLNEIVKLSEGKFPTFIKVKNNNAVYKWGNMELGVRSLDWIEEDNF